MSWKQRGSIDTYYIYRSKFSDTAKTVDTIITVENNYCYYTDDEDTMDIESGMLWHYWIRARKNGKLGAWTPDNDEGLLAYSQPDMPVIDTVSQGISADTIRVQWSKIKYAKKYLVQYKDQEKQEWIELGTNVIDTFYTFERETEGLKDGIRYEFRVTAVISVSTESPVGLEYGGSYGRTMHSDTSQSKTGYLRFEKIKNFYFQSAFDSIKSDTIRLYWDQLDVNDVTYTIYRDTQDTPATAPQLQNMDDKGEYLDIKRSNEQHPEGGRQYYYWITSEKATFAGNTQSEKQAVTVINESNSGTDHYGWALLDQPENIWASGKMQAAGGDNNQELTYTDSIVIKWDKVINAKNYQIQQRRKDIETTWQDLETEELDTQYVWSMSSDSLKGRVYEFQVTAKNELSGDKNPVYSDITTGFAKLPAPRLPRAYTKEFTSGVFLEWDRIENADEYQIYRSDFEDKDFTKWATVKQRDTEEIDTLDNTMDPGDRKFYYIRSYNKSTGKSDTSDVVTQTCPVLPPDGLTATKGEKDKVTLTWILNGKTIFVDGFYVYRTAPGSVNEAFTDQDTIAKITEFDQGAGKYIFEDTLGMSMGDGVDTTRSGKKYLYAIKTFKNWIFISLPVPKVGG